MGETISMIADICGILGFFISIFAASRVISLSKQNRQTAIGKDNKQKMKVGN